MSLCPCFTALLRLFPLLTLGVLVLIEVRVQRGGKPFGFIGQVVERLGGIALRHFEEGVFGQTPDNPLPARDAFVQPLKRFADIGLTVAILVQIRSELVDQCGKVLEFAVQAARAARLMPLAN